MCQVQGQRRAHPKLGRVLAKWIQQLCALRRNETSCNAWTWCADEETCPDERGVAIPLHGCQLKEEPVEPWGLPDEAYVKRFQPSTFASGYMKSAPGCFGLASGHFTFRSGS